jgi:molybdopterin-guanine dinucleotide biosynthesis protein A
VADAPLLTGVLLAGGTSRRMGEDKTAADFLFDGEPLAARVAGRLAQACDDVLIASGDGTRMAWLGLPQVPDALPDSGPLGGLVAGLEAATHPHVAVVAADMPFASPAVLRLLASRIGGHDAAVPASEQGTEPLHAVYARSALGSFEAALRAGRLSVRVALEGLDALVVTEADWARADPAGRFARNLNRPGDSEPFVEPPQRN